MARGGWYKQYRAIFDHPLLTGDVASRVHAFSDLVSMAEFEPVRRRAGGQMIDLERGEVLASVRFLSERWKWGKGKVQRFLADLEADSMLGTARETPGGTVYLILNYETYQAPQDSERDTKRDSDGTGAGQIEEVKNITNDLSITPRVEMERDANGYAASLEPGPARTAFNAEVRGIVTGDNAQAWKVNATGESVPWEERPRLLRLALDGLQQGKAKNLYWSVVYAVNQQYDPLKPRTAEELQRDRPKAGTEAAAVRSEYPQQRHAATTGGLTLLGGKPEARTEIDLDAQRVRKWAETNPEAAADLRTRIASEMSRDPLAMKNPNAARMIADGEFAKRVKALLQSTEAA